MWRPVEGGGGGGAPCARGKHSATLLGGRVLVLGGRGAGGSLPLKDFWAYTLADGRWERLSSKGSPPPALQEHTAVARGDCLYVFGGEAGALSTETPLWIYNTQTAMWRKLPGCPPGKAGAGPRGRRGHTAHGLSDCMLVYGGYKDLRGSTNELWAFHYESESWQQVRTGGAGPPRHRHAAVLHRTRLYVHAGMHDLRHCADLWHYDTMSRTWHTVRCPAKLSPSARSGHAAVRAGSHMYIFGGETQGHISNELWRFHFGSETWERVNTSTSWPAPRVDCAALLAPAPRSPPRTPTPPAPAPRPAGILREMSRLHFSMKRHSRCSYSVLAVDPDSAESLLRLEPAPAAPLPKSHSAYIIDKRQVEIDEPKEADEAEFRCDVSREPISVPDFADMVLPTPVVSPTEATKLVYLDSEDEDYMPPSFTSKNNANHRAMDMSTKIERVVVAIPKSASVRFSKDVTTMVEDESEMSTSDYASAERVNRLPGMCSGFCNPNYLGPDVRKLGVALTPDSGVGPGDIELQDLSDKRVKGDDPVMETRPSDHLRGEALLMLVIGGKENAHAALLQRPLSMWTYRLL